MCNNIITATEMKQHDELKLSQKHFTYILLLSQNVIHRKQTVFTDGLKKEFLSERSNIL